MILIREMRESDVDQVCILETEAFSMPWNKESFLDMIKNENAIYLVAEENNVILGNCGLINMAGEGEIVNVTVEKEHRNQKIGFHMMTELLKRGNQIGISSFTLEVRVSNTMAIHLYENLGFRSEGIRKNFYEKPREDANIMWKR